MSRLMHPKRRSRTALIIAATVALAAVVMAVLFAGSATPQPAPPTPAVAKHFVDVPQGGGGNAALRTVVIAGPGERLPFMSETGSVLMASLERGRLPTAATRAT